MVSGCGWCWTWSCGHGLLAGHDDRLEGRVVKARTHNRCADGQAVLARTATRPLARHHDPLQDQLASPDAPRLAPLEGTGKALGLQRATGAERLGLLDLCRGLGEEQLGVDAPTGELGSGPFDQREGAVVHLGHLLATLLVQAGFGFAGRLTVGGRWAHRCRADTKKAAVP